MEGILPPLDMKDLEQTKEILMKDQNEELLIDMEDYPYFTTIKKLIYAFGDKYCNNSHTVLYLHDFLKQFLLSLARILKECEFKKIIEHLYSYEYEKFHNYKKLKFKNNFMTGDDLDENCDGNANNKNSSSVVNDKKKNSNTMCFNDNYLSSSDEFDIGIAVEEEEKESANTKLRKKNYFENILKDQDENYFENLAFQDERTSKMEKNEYLEFIACRQQTFLSKGKKTFLIYLQSILQSNFPSELKDISNLELISFILKEVIRKVITEAIKNKHPAKKLFMISLPLVVEDIEDLCKEEVDKLDSFLKDFYSDLFLIKEFKKNKLSKKNNKNVKVTKTQNGIALVIKKYIFLDQEQSEILRKIRKSSENKVLHCINILNDIYVKIKNRKSKRNLRTRTRETGFQDGSNVNPNTKWGSYSNSTYPINFSIKSLVCNVFSLDNFYEYFLIKDYLKEITEDELKHADLTSRIAQLNKKTKKKIVTKFDEWIRMGSTAREGIIEEYREIIKEECTTSN